MARAKKLTRETLISLGAEQLADILIDQVPRNKALGYAVRIALSELDGPEAVAKEIRKRISAIGRSSAFVSGRDIRALVGDLDQVCAMIVGKVAPAHADLAVELMWRFLDLADSVFERCDDSSGYIGDTFRRAIEELGPIAARSSSEPEALADQVVARLRNNGYGIYDELITELYPALGMAGTTHLKANLEKWKLQQEAAGSDRENSGRFAIFNAQQAVADVEGDVDAFIALHDEELLANPVFVARIAERLVSADRAEDALVFLDRAPPRDDFGVRQWHNARISAAVALGDQEQSQALRWQMFENALGASYLRAYLKALPEFEDVEVEDQALAYVEAHADVHRAIDFLIDWPALDRAARVIVHRHDEIDGNRYELLDPAAARLDEKHPLAAAILHRALIEHTLNHAKSTRYKHGARHLLELHSLDRRISDYGQHEDHSAFIERLKQTHPRKTGFWGQLPTEFDSERGAGGSAG